jgi:hypothetical protein
VKLDDGLLVVGGSRVVVDQSVWAHNSRVLSKLIRVRGFKSTADWVKKLLFARSCKENVGRLGVLYSSPVLRDGGEKIFTSAI